MTVKELKDQLLLMNDDDNVLVHVVDMQPTYVKSTEIESVSFAKIKTEILYPGIRVKTNGVIIARM